MAVIENYSSQRPLPVNRSNAQDFADTRGLENIARAADESSKLFQQEGDRLAQVQEIEDKLVIARKMAEFDQQWVIEINNRRQAVEEGRMSASGMTEMFQKDYGKASDELAATIPNRRMSEETRIRLIERQTSMIGSLMDFEARKRAEGIKKNYEDTQAIYINQMITADRPEALYQAYELANKTAEMYPPELRDETLEKNTLLLAKKSMAFAQTSKQAKEVNDSYMSSGYVTDQGAATIGADYVGRVNEIQAKSISVINSELQNQKMMASFGMAVMPNPEFYDALSEITDPEIKSQVAEAVAANEKLNENRKIINQTNSGFSQLMLEYDQKIMSAKSNQEAADLSREKSVLASAKIERDNHIAKDPALFINQTNTKVIEAAELYRLDPTDKNREKYYDAMDNGFAEIGWRGSVNYLTTDEANNIVGNLKKSILKENGVKEVEQQIAQMTQTYGKRIGSVMQQIVAVDKDVMPATMVARIAMNGGDRNKTLDIIKAVSAINTDPKPYDLKDKDIPPPQGYSDVITAMIAQDMVQENQERRETYEAVYKYYKRNNVRNPEKAAADVVYSDMKSNGTIIVPAAYKSVSDIVNRANKTAADFISKDLIELPELTNQFSKQDILSNPAAVIEWRNMPDGAGIQAVWAGSNGNPVYDKFGNRLQYKYMQYDIDLAENPIVQSRPSTGFKTFNEDMKERR